MPSVGRAKWNLLALSRSAYGALFLRALTCCLSFAFLARSLARAHAYGTRKDLSSLAADYSARYHWHFTSLSLADLLSKYARFAKLVVAVYEFFGGNVAQIQFTRADGRRLVASVPCVPLREKPTRQKEEIKTDRENEAEREREKGRK